MLRQGGSHGAVARRPARLLLSPDVLDPSHPVLLPGLGLVDGRGVLVLELAQLLRGPSVPIARGDQPQVREVLVREESDGDHQARERGSHQREQEAEHWQQLGRRAVLLDALGLADGVGRVVLHLALDHLDVDVGTEGAVSRVRLDEGGELGQRLLHVAVPRHELVVTDDLLRVADLLIELHVGDQACPPLAKGIAEHVGRPTGSNPVLADLAEVQRDQQDDRRHGGVDDEEEPAGADAQLVLDHRPEPSPCCQGGDEGGDDEHPEQPLRQQLVLGLGLACGLVGRGKLLPGVDELRGLSFFLHDDSLPSLVFDPPRGR